MKWRGSIACFVLITSLWCMAPSASAHVLQVDGHIAALLHINPDDDPISGVATTYDLSFTDDTGKFTLATCDCSVTIQMNDRTVAVQQLPATHGLQAADTYTFPRPGVYTMGIHGRPIRPGSFQTFTLTYLLRVTARDTSVQAFPPLLAVGLGLLIALVLLGAYASEYMDNGTKT